MNKKQYRMMIVLFLIIIIILLIYSNIEKIKRSEKSIFLEEYKFRLTLPEGWKEVDDTQFDLQLTSGRAYVSVFVYFKNELAELQIPLDVQEQHLKDLFSKREYVEKITEENIIELTDKVIYSVLYSAEYNGVENYYYCNLVDFKGEADIFAWILVSALPSYFTENNDIWSEIIETVKWEK